MINTQLRQEILRNQQQQLNASLEESIEQRNIEDIIKNLKRGADINKQSYKDQYPPLIKAILFGDVDIVNVLINRGADLNLLTEIQHIHDYEPDEDDVEHADFDLIEENLTPLIAAVKYNLPKMVILLLDKGANIHVVDLDGNNVMHHAISLFSQDHDGDLTSTINMTKMLLNKGASFKVKNNNGISAFDEAKLNFPELLALFENHLLTVSANQSLIDPAANCSAAKRNRL